MNTNQSSKWVVDVVLFGLLLLAFFLELTGVEAHQWLGVAAGSLALYHLVDHCDWAVATARKFVTRASAKARQFFLVDAGLLIGFIVTGFTGIVISTWMSLALDNYTAWRDVHVVASLATLVLAVVKVGLHARWIIAVGRKTFSMPAAAPLAPRPVLEGGSIHRGRREFLQVMGVVSVASLVAFNKGAASLNSAAEGGSQTMTTTASAASSNNVITTTSTSSNCLVQCNRRCSYPGHCHRYSDQNGNGRCDYGECA